MRKSLFLFGNKGNPGRAKGGLLGVGLWSDFWVLVQVEEHAKGPLTVGICEFIPVEGDGPARLLSILQQRNIEKSQGVGVLTPGQYRTFLEESVNAPPEELGSIMRWRVRDRLDFPVENAVISVQPVAIRKKDDTAEKSMVNVFIANQDEIIRLSTLATRLHMTLLAVDAHESALRHVASHLDDSTAGGMILLHVGVQDTQVMAIRETEIVFSRRIKVGTERLQELLRVETTGREKALTSAVEPLAMELQRTLEYIRTRMQMTVGKIYLAPLENPVAGLSETLGRLLPGVVVSPLDLAKIFNFVNGIPEERNLAMALPVLGAVLGQIRSSHTQVNLLEERLRPKTNLLSGKPILGMGLLSTLILGLLLGTLQWHMGRIRAEFAQVSSREATLQAEVQQLVDSATDKALNIRLENMAQQLMEKISINKRLMEFLSGNKLGQQEGFAGHLEDLSQCVIPGVWLTGITLQNGGQDMGFSGKGESMELVPRFIESLGRTAHFRNKRFDILQIMNKNADDGEPVSFLLRTKHIPDMKKP
ncbi:MAG: PilN domain-containing protein [Magnetococcus sp. DMHC-1]|nr:hypothetical protein [Magnetococcales bacterium]MBF0154892.1 hypothetical protein [Magnetococcales bacterium]